MPDTVKCLDMSQNLNKLFHEFPKPNKYYGKFLLIDALWNVYAYNLTDIYKLSNCLSENYKYIKNYTFKHFTNTA